MSAVLRWLAPWRTIRRQEEIIGILLDTIERLTRPAREAPGAE